MKPSEARCELLEQHAQIRIMLDVMLTMAKGARVGAPGRSDLQGSVVRLAEALRTHNQREEELLRDFIPSVDAWGPARAAIMTEEHKGEHDRLDAALSGVPRTPIEFAAAGIVALVALIRQHMDREEAAFLGEDVLRDDVVVTNQSSG
jgi:hemerythrin HHE cation binding domain-containing protein